MNRENRTMRQYVRNVISLLPTSLGEMLRAFKRFVLNLRSRERVFAKIARDNIWDGTESISGPGSTLRATASLRAALPEVLSQRGVESILDIPCGDAYWISQCIPSHVRYTGADIVSELIQRNLLEKPDLGEFVVLDLVSDPLPRSDLVIVRDCFIHLPNATILKALSNIKKSGSRLLLATHYPEEDINIDIEVGGFRPINLERLPFELPAPALLIEDSDAIDGSGKHMGLWRIEDL